MSSYAEACEDCEELLRIVQQLKGEYLELYAKSVAIRDERDRLKEEAEELRRSRKQEIAAAIAIQRADDVSRVLQQAREEIEGLRDKVREVEGWRELGRAWRLLDERAA